MAELGRNVNKPPFFFGAPDAASGTRAAQAPPPPLTTPISAHRHAPRPPLPTRRLRPALGLLVVPIGFRQKLRPLARGGSAPLRRLSARGRWPRKGRGSKPGLGVWASSRGGGSLCVRVFTHLCAHVCSARYTYRGVYTPLCVYSYPLNMCITLHVSLTLYIGLYRDISFLYIYSFERGQKWYQNK